MLRPAPFVAALLILGIACGGEEPPSAERAPVTTPEPPAQRVDHDSPTDDDLARMREQMNTTDLALAAGAMVGEGSVRVTFTIANRGPNQALVPTLRIAPPATVAPAPGLDSRCRPEGAAWECLLAPLPSGASVELAVDFVPVREGGASAASVLEASVRNERGPDPEPANDRASVSVTL